MKEENKKTEIKKCELCNSDFIINTRSKKERNKKFCTPKCAKSHNGKSNKGRKFSNEINKKKDFLEKKILFLENLTQSYQKKK